MDTPGSVAQLLRRGVSSIKVEATIPHEGSVRIDVRAARDEVEVAVGIPIYEGRRGVRPQPRRRRGYRPRSGPRRVARRRSQRSRNSSSFRSASRRQGPNRLRWARAVATACRHGRGASVPSPSRSDNVGALLSRPESRLANGFVASATKRGAVALPVFRKYASVSSRWPRTRSRSPSSSTSASVGFWGDQIHVAVSIDSPRR